MWNGAVASGYGTIRWGNRMMGAHVVSFLLSGRTPGVGQQVLHTCDIKLCVRPDHLWAGTQRENMDDMLGKGRQSHHPPAIPFGKGETNIGAKITTETARLVKQMHRDGARQADIMRATGVTRANVWAIVHGLSWTHIVVE